MSVIKIIYLMWGNVYLKRLLIFLDKNEVTRIMILIREII